MRLAIDLSESFQIAMSAIRANKARGALTTLGIIIGIIAVVLTMTAANGLNNRFRQSFAAVGADVIYVSRMPWIIMDDFFQYRNRPAIKLREARDLEQRLRGTAIVNPTLIHGAKSSIEPRRWKACGSSARPKNRSWCPRVSRRRAGFWPRLM